MSGDRIAATGELVAEQLEEGVVGQLGLLQADDVRLPLVQPRQQPRHALLDRVDVPRRDAHRLPRYPPVRATRLAVRLRTPTTAGTRSDRASRRCWRPRARRPRGGATAARPSRGALRARRW